MLGWLFGRKPEKPKRTVIVHTSAQANKATALAWTLYGGAKAQWRDGAYPEARVDGSPFVEECFARDVVAEWWGVQPAEFQAQDSYMQLLARVRSAGLLREYVWRFLREPGWAEPPGLDLGRLEAWLAAEGVADHRPLTLATVGPG